MDRYDAARSYQAIGTKCFVVFAGFIYAPELSMFAMKKQIETSKVEQTGTMTLADLLLRPRNVSNALAQSESAFLGRSLALLVIFSALIGGIYGGVFSQDKIFILHDSYKIVIVNVLTVLLAFPLMAIMLHLFGGKQMVLISSPFKKAFSVLAISRTYLPLTLLLTAPAYVLSALKSNNYLSQPIFGVLVIFSGIVSAIMLAIYLRGVYNLDYLQVVPIAILISFYMLLLSINLLSLFGPYTGYVPYADNVQFFGAASSALTIVD